MSASFVDEEGSQRKLEVENGLRYPQRSCSNNPLLHYQVD